MCFLLHANIPSLHSLLADWDDDDPALRPNVSLRQDRTVVLKGLFTLQEIKASAGIWPRRIAISTRLTCAVQEDVEAILDIKEDVRDECNKIGEVTNVVLYDQEPEGVVTVKFAQPDDAQECVRVRCFCSAFDTPVFQSPIFWRLGWIIL